MNFSAYNPKLAYINIHYVRASCFNYINDMLVILILVEMIRALLITPTKW